MNANLGAQGFIARVGLPDFDLQIFSGDYIEWPEWSLDFHNFVHDNPALSLSQKLGYLKRFLGDQPRSQVFGLLWDKNDYVTALKELRRLYGDPSRVIDSSIDRVESENGRC